MTFQVILHEGVIAEAVRPRLVREMRRVAADVFGAPAANATVEMTEIPRGRFFTAAQPSRSSLVGTTVPPGTSPADRTRLMAEITSAWCDVTGCTPDEIVVSASGT